MRQTITPDLNPTSKKKMDDVAMVETMRLGWYRNSTAWVQTAQLSLSY